MQKLQILEYRQIRLEIVERIRGLVLEWSAYHRPMESVDDQTMFRELEKKLIQLTEREAQMLERRNPQSVGEFMSFRKQAQEWRRLGRDPIRGIEGGKATTTMTGDDMSSRPGSAWSTDYGGGHGPPWNGRVRPLVPAGKAGSMGSAWLNSDYSQSEPSLDLPNCIPQARGPSDVSGFSETDLTRNSDFQTLAPEFAAEPRPP
jgi:hypothetical protein